MASSKAAGRSRGEKAQAPGEEKAEEVVRVLKALAHPIRYRIMRLLADKDHFGIADETCCERDEVCVCRIKDLFDIPAPTLSHHLKLLREAGLISGRREGVWIYYSIRPGALDGIVAALLGLAYLRSSRGT